MMKWLEDCQAIPGSLLTVFIKTTQSLATLIHFHSFLNNQWLTSSSFLIRFSITTQKCVSLIVWPNGRSINTLDVNKLWTVLYRMCVSGTLVVVIHQHWLQRDSWAAEKPGRWLSLYVARVRWDICPANQKRFQVKGGWGRGVTLYFGGLFEPGFNE